MTATRYIVNGVRCDTPDCDEEDEIVGPRSEMWPAMRADGWTRIGRIDLCPKCSAKARGPQLVDR